MDQKHFFSGLWKRATARRSLCLVRVQTSFRRLRELTGDFTGDFGSTNAFLYDPTTTSGGTRSPLMGLKNGTATKNVRFRPATLEPDRCIDRKFVSGSQLPCERRGCQ